MFKVGVPIGKSHPVVDSTLSTDFCHLDRGRLLGLRQQLLPGQRVLEGPAGRQQGLGRRGMHADPRASQPVDQQEDERIESEDWTSNHWGSDHPTEVLSNEIC